MKLLNKVKDKLEKKKGYDFESDFWTDENLVIVYDSVYMTEKVLKKQRDEMLEMLQEIVNYTTKEFADKWGFGIQRQKAKQLIEKSKP
jgi:aminopeptidase-like protein